MQRIASFVLFLAIALSVLGGFHVYLWTRLVRDPAWPAPWGRVATYVVLSLGATIPVGLVTARLRPAKSPAGW